MALRSRRPEKSQPGHDLLPLPELRRAPRPRQMPEASVSHPVPTITRPRQQSFAEQRRGQFFPTREELIAWGLEPCVNAPRCRTLVNGTLRSRCTSCSRTRGGGP